jgi:hypothetical protein
MVLKLSAYGTLARFLALLGIYSKCNLLLWLLSGFFGPPDSYFADPWNRLDAFIVVTSMLSLILPVQTILTNSSLCRLH